MCNVQCEGMAERRTRGKKIIHRFCESDRYAQVHYNVFAMGLNESNDQLSERRRAKKRRTANKSAGEKTSVRLRVRYKYNTRMKYISAFLNWLQFSVSFALLLLRCFSYSFALIDDDYFEAMHTICSLRSAYVSANARARLYLFIYV